MEILPRLRAETPRAVERRQTGAQPVGARRWVAELRAERHRPGERRGLAERQEERVAPSRGGAQATRSGT